MGFWGDFGERGQDIWWEPIGEKIMEMFLVCTLGKVITKKHKKRNVYAVRVTFHPCAALTPLNP